MTSNRSKVSPSQKSMSDAMHAAPRIAFHLTGFGAFGTKDRIEVNPSARLVETLNEALAQRPLPAHTRIASARVLRVAGKSAAEAVATLPCDGKGEEGDTCVCVHLGVHSHTKTFLLERCAWNEASFRDADEDGWTPNAEPVVLDAPLGACLSTGVPVAALAQALSGLGFTTAVSEDPGRYVCNFLYCAALKAASQDQPPRPTLFVHIPPLDVCPLPEQQRFLCALLHELAALYSRTADDAE
jgi:pyroglutamyl-peptidase